MKASERIYATLSNRSTAWVEERSDGKDGCPELVIVQAKDMLSLNDTEVLKLRNLLNSYYQSQRTHPV